MGQLDSITHSVDMNLSKLWELVKDSEAWRGVTELETTQQLNNKSIRIVIGANKSEFGYNSACNLC